MTQEEDKLHTGDILGLTVKGRLQNEQISWQQKINAGNDREITSSKQDVGKTTRKNAPTGKGDTGSPRRRSI